VGRVASVQVESETKAGGHAIFVGRVVTSHMHEGPGVRRLYTVGNGYRMDGVVPG